MLVLDEGQSLRTLVAGPFHGLVQDTLCDILNGEVRAPVVLLAGGLGHSADVFAEFRIARFTGRCQVRLGRLSSGAEVAVIRDWLTKGRGAGENSDTMERCVTAIAVESHGWPLPLMANVRPGAERLRADGAELSDDGIDAVLADGC